MIISLIKAILNTAPIGNSLAISLLGAHVTRGHLPRVGILIELGHPSL